MRHRTFWVLLASTVTMVGCGQATTPPTGLQAASVVSGLDAYQSAGQSTPAPRPRPDHGKPPSGGWDSDWQCGKPSFCGGGFGGYDGFFPGPYLPPIYTFGLGLPYPAYQFAFGPGFGFGPGIGAPGFGFGPGIGAPGFGFGPGIGAPGVGFGPGIGAPGVGFGGIGAPGFGGIGGIGAPGVGFGGVGGPVITQPPTGGAPSGPIPGWPGSGQQPQSQYSQGIVDEYRQLDKNNDRMVTRDEYIQGKVGMIRYVQAPSQQQMRQMYSQFASDFQRSDRDGNGMLMIDEFANAPVFSVQR